MAEPNIALKMSMDATAIGRALTSVKAQLDSFAKEKFAGFKEMFGVAALAASVKIVGDQMVQLRRSAEDVGASVGFLMTLQQMSERFGGTAEDANVAMTKLAETIGQARTEGGAAAEKFSRFGVSLYEVNGAAKSTETLFKEIADAYKSMADPALKAALAVEFFGKTGRNINNILGEGASGIEEYSKKFLGLETGLVAGDVNAIADAWHNLKEFIGGAYDVAKMFLGRTIDGLGSIFRLLGSISTGKNPMEAWNLEMEFWENRDKPTQQNAGTRVEDQKKQIESLEKARATSAAAQMTDEQKLVQVEKQRAEIEAKMREQSAGSAEFIKLENDLLLKGYEARKLQLDIAARLVEQEKMSQQLDAAKAEFKVLEVAKRELELKLQIAALNEGDPRRANMERELVGMVEKRLVLERAAKELELKQLQDRGEQIEKEMDGIGYAAGTELEYHKKVEEARKNELEIAKKAKEIEEDKLDVLRKQGDAQERATRARQTLAEAKESRFKFTLEELAAADPRRFRGGVRESVVGARDVQRLEALAMQANLRNDPKERDRLQELADKRRESLGFLKKEERFPFEDLKKSAQQSADELQALLKSGKAVMRVGMAN